MTQYALGRVVQHDPRSLAFPAALASALKTVTHRHYGPVLDQGQVGSCTGNAAAQSLNTVPLRHGRRLLTEIDAQDLYHEATVLDGYPGTWPPDDTGSSGLAVAKASQQAGWVTGYTHAFGLDQCLAALVLAPVIVGTNWHEDMFNPDAAGYVHPTGAIAGGHEYTLLGINVKLQRVTMLNSWSASWGRNGRAYITFDDLGALLADSGDVVSLNR
jgi:C1A family cysteine protease